jgi:hypothetical protein
MAKRLVIEMNDEDYEDLMVEARKQGIAANDYALWLVLRRETTHRPKQSDGLPNAPYVQKG